jgi:uncharacterized membrane protein
MQHVISPRTIAVAAQLATGLLAGAFFYGWANVNPTFAAVPLDVHLTFRTELMKQNAIVMQALMAASFVTSAGLAVAARGQARVCAAAATALAVATFLVTRFGNVPFNAEIREWTAGALAPDHQDQLATWGVYNDIRVATAVGAFALIAVAAGALRSTMTAVRP